MSPKAEYSNGVDIKTFNMRNRSTNKSDVIDFGFVKKFSANGNSTGLKFVPNKMMRDIAYVHEEVVMDMFINPLFENESDSQVMKEENESYESYEQSCESSKEQKKSRFSFRRKSSRKVRVTAI